MTHKPIILSLQETTQKLLEDLHVYHENYISVLRCLHVFTSSLPKYPLGKQVMYSYSILVKCRGVLFQSMTRISIYSFSLFTLLLLYPALLLSGYGQRATAYGFFNGVDDTLSINRKHFPGESKCIVQQRNPHVDFPTGAVCMHCSIPFQ